MANIKGLVTSYGQVGEHEDLADLMRDASSYKTPLFSYMERVKGGAKASTHQYVEDKRRATTTTLSGAYTTSSGALAAVADGSIFVIGDFIMIDSEVIRIGSISSNNLGAVGTNRGWGGTVTTAHASGATVIRLPYAGVAGAAAPSANATLKVTAFNYCQAIEDTIQVSFEERGQRSVGGDEYDYQVAKRMKEHAIGLELMNYYGARAIGTATSPATAGGLFEWITTNTYNFAGLMNKQQFNSKIRGVYTNGGADEPDVLLASPVVMEAIDFWAESVLRTTIAEKKSGAHVGKLTTPYGELDILPSRHLISGHFVVIQSDMFKWAPLNGDMNLDTKLYPLARTGSADQALLYTNATIQRACEYAHFFGTGVTGGA